MSTSRLTLNSPVFVDRVKKFDSYNHKAESSSRRSPQRTDAVARSVKTPTKRNVPSVVSNTPQRMTSKTHLSSVIPAKTQTGGSSFNECQTTHKLALNAVRSTSAKRETEIGEQFASIARHNEDSRLGKRHKVLYSIAAFVFLFSSIVSVHTLISNQRNKQQIQNVMGEAKAFTSTDSEGVVQGTGNQPAEQSVPKSALANYQVYNPEHPRYLRIPEINVFSRVKKLGEKAGAIDAPWNIHDVGWFEGSAKPGNSKGSSLLMGHVSGWTEDGVFKNIDKLRQGSTFEVEKGSGEKIRYEVTRSESIPVDSIDMGKILGTEVAGEHDLKLMTCSGKYNHDTETYEERMVVYAKVLSE